MSQSPHEPKLKTSSEPARPGDAQLRPASGPERRMPFNLKTIFRMSYTVGVSLMAVALMFLLVDQAQKTGWFSSENTLDVGGTESGVTRDICPMMCVEPTSQPGRCPVCEMELVAATMGPVFIDPATRRILTSKLPEP